MKKGKRMTAQKKLIISILESSNDPMTANEIFNLAKLENKRIAKSTIYRNLENMLESDEIYRGQFESGENYYHLICKHHHHHHMICSSCDLMIGLPECPISDWEKEIAKKYSFETTSHIVQLYGICQNCKTKKQ